MVPLLVIAWARIFEAAAAFAPGIFAPIPPEDINYPSTLVFVLENLLHTQIFVDTFEIYGVRLAELRHAGFLGGLLTFLMRLVFNLGIIAVLVSFGMIWFNRILRAFKVSPNAELVLRQEVAECGPQAGLLVGFHYREIRDFLVEAMRQQRNKEELLVPLAGSGFFAGFLAIYGPVKEGEELGDVASWHRHIAVALRTEGRLNEAFLASDQALHLFQRLPAGDDKEGQANELALVYCVRGVVLAGQRKFPESIAAYQGSISYYQQLVDEGRRDLRMDLAGTQQNLGQVLWEHGDLDQAISVLRQSLKLCQDLVNEGNLDARVPLAFAQHHLGTALWKKGETDQAVVVYRQSIALKERLIQEGQMDTPSSALGLRLDLAGTVMNLGLALRDQRKLDQARAEFNKCIELLQRLVREGQREARNELVRAEMNLANALTLVDRLDESIAVCRQALELSNKFLLEGQTEFRNLMGGCYLSLGSALRKRGQIGEAIEALNKSREICDRLANEGQTDARETLAFAKREIARALCKQGRFEEGMVDFLRAMEVFEHMVAEGHFRLLAGLAETWHDALVASQQIAGDRGLGLVRSALNFLRNTSAPANVDCPEAKKEILMFLQLVQQEGLAAGEAAALTREFAS